MLLINRDEQKHHVHHHIALSIDRQNMHPLILYITTRAKNAASGRFTDVHIRTYQTLHKTTVKKWQNKMEAVEMGLEVIKEIGTNLYAIHKSKERKSRFPTVY